MPPQKLRRNRSGDFEATVLRAGDGRFGAHARAQARASGGKLKQLAARSCANVGTNQSLPLEFFDLVVDRLDRERRAAAAVHALLQMAIHDAGRRNWRVGLIENFDERALDVAVGDHGAGTDDHDALRTDVRAGTATGRVVPANVI